MKPFYGHSGSWIDEKSTFSMEAGSDISVNGNRN